MSSASQYVCERCGLPLHLFWGKTWRHSRGGRSTEKPCDQAMPILRTTYEERERAALHAALNTRGFSLNKPTPATTDEDLEKAACWLDGSINAVGVFELRRLAAIVRAQKRGKS